MPITTQAHVNASDFFHNLSKKAKVIAEEEAEKMANSMVYILRHRQMMKGGNGQFPRWDNKGQSSVQSKKSFDAWMKQKRPNGEWWIANPATNPVDDYGYVRNLVTGKGWSAKVRNAPQPHRRLVRKGGLIFSSQMPNGLNPWLKIKRQDFEDKLKVRLHKELS